MSHLIITPPGVIYVVALLSLSLSLAMHATPVLLPYVVYFARLSRE